MKRVLETIEKIAKWGGLKRDWVCLVISAITLMLSFFKVGIFPFDPAWIAVVLCGTPIVVEASLGLFTRFDIKADVLVAIAIIASIYLGEYFAAGEVALIMVLGEKLEDLSYEKSRGEIQRLTSLSPKTACLVDASGTEQEVLVEDVRVGDVLRIRPGEIVPVDGTILRGETSVDQKALTGESTPVDKGVGSVVASGSQNLYGAFEMRADKVGTDSSIQRIVQLVNAANVEKSRLVCIADKWATVLVIACMIAAVATYVVTGSVVRAVTILIVFCPCAFVLATPTALIAALGNATKHGFLLRSADVLETLALVDVAVFDKTGTLTGGVLNVSCVRSFDPLFSDDSILRFAAAVEHYSEHPVGQAIVRAWAEKDGAFDPVVSFHPVPGHGVSGMVGGNKVVVGKSAFLESEGVDLSAAVVNDSSDKTGTCVVLVAVNGRLVGSISAMDCARMESRGAIAALKPLRIRPILMSGDSRLVAGEIARRVGIDDVYAECLPEDKLTHITTFQKEGHIVCMTGDGINDAPSLRQANVGIAMGGVGADLAIEASDVVLAHDEICELPFLFALARKTETTIVVNLVVSCLVSVVAVWLAAIGVLGPVAGALVHNGVSCAVVLNSVSLLCWRREKDRVVPSDV